MGNEANVLESAQTDKKIHLETNQKTRKLVSKATPNEKIEIQLGVRALMTTPIPACEKLDRMFGSGGEAIVHHMWFESGHSLFDNMIKRNPSRSLEELLEVLVESQQSGGWGDICVKMIHRNPPMVNIVIGNPAVKTVKGSQKYLIGSFWTGVLSRYFAKQLICKNFEYDARTDEFSCTITA